MSTFVRTPGTRCASSRHTVEARTRAKSRSTCRGPAPAPPTHVMVSLEESERAKSLICRRCAVDNLVESGGKGRNTTERVGATVVVVVVGATVVDVVVGATVVVVVVVGATVVVVDVDVVATGTIAGATVVVAESPPPPPDVGAAVVVGATVVDVVVVGATVVVVVVGATVVVVVVVGATVVVVGATVVVVVVVVVVVGAVGMTVSLVSETTPSPIALRALTRKRYDVVFVSPDTDAEVRADTPSAKVVQLEPSVEYSTM